MTDQKPATHPDVPYQWTAFFSSAPNRDRDKTVKTQRFTRQWNPGGSDSMAPIPAAGGDQHLESLEHPGLSLSQGTELHSFGNRAQNLKHS